MTALAEKLKSILGKIDEALGEEDWNEIRSVENDVDALITALTESEAVALLTDEPSKTAEELAEKILRLVDADKVDLSKGKSLRELLIDAEKKGADILKTTSALIHSALTQAKAEARREAADDFCALRPGKGQVCIMDDRDKCHDRAAILGRKP